MNCKLLNVAVSLLATVACTATPNGVPGSEASAVSESMASSERDSVKGETDDVSSDLPDRYARLTEDDYRQVAEELGVEVAAIKAVVDIEAGVKHQGFSAPGKALVNFDLSMFRKFSQNRGVNLNKYRKSHSTVFSAPNAKKYGSHQAAQLERLEQAKTINHDAAIEGTFWGMFQIGGFNWKKCGAESLDDFERRMNLSEREQLEMFAQFMKNDGLVKYLKNKDWAGFALRYNGPGYRKRNYHGRMAAAYNKYKKKK
ncbi:MAG: N-acetylmuramidase family protein [Muribaculaceae bacterium]|nr:N-acetylmuramidase family protein [Muribaculaceae bacterium]MDE6321123.1 N-acetylmuramidase family protein [Muribaculaceae bacterium]